MQRLEFVSLGSKPGVNFKALCERTDISRRVGYKWLKRYREGGVAALEDQSRRPKRSPRQCDAAVTALVIAQREREPTWGGRKLRRRLQDLAHAWVPAASTCTEILRRANLLGKTDCAPTTPWQRFERTRPNELWQMDFKGPFPMQCGQRCHPFTVLDDASRFNLALQPCANETGCTVQAALTVTFKEYGLPEEILCDNGPPWGCSDPVCPYTWVTVWLLQHGVRVLHGRPFHPQTQGKDERFHRTLKAELISRHTWNDLSHCAREFPRYRERYNCTRPHDALQGDTPVSRYRPSPRSLPRMVSPPEYAQAERIKRVRTSGVIKFERRTWYVGRAFAGLTVGLRPSAQADGQWEVFFGVQRLGLIDLTTVPLASTAAHSIYQNP
jgi:transposase InsO family protein